MKKIWILFSIIPCTAFCQTGAYDLFQIAASGEESLVHITSEEEAFDNFSCSLGIFEDDLSGETKELHLPWARESIASKEDDAEDSFSYELASSKERKGPTYENVPQTKSLLFHKSKKELKNEKQSAVQTPKAAENEQKSPTKRPPLTVKDGIRIIGPEASPQKSALKK